MSENKIYDSEDPNFPDLPEDDEVSWSDYDGYLSSSDSESSDSNSIKTSFSRLRHDKINIPSAHPQTSPSTGPQQEHEVRHTSSFPFGTKSGSRSRRRKKKSARKYKGSNIKKEKAAWEPGIDVNTTRVEFADTPGSTITITDYCKERYRVERLDLYSSNGLGLLDTSFGDIDDSCTNEVGSENDPEISEILETTAYMVKVSDSVKNFKRSFGRRPSWSKVRWVNVNGLSWEAISLISEHYGLHRLAVEDMVDIPQRTKVDVYQNQLFCVLPLMKLIKTEKPKYRLKKALFTNDKKVVATKVSGSDSEVDEENVITKLKNLFLDNHYTENSNKSSRPTKDKSLNSLISDELKMQKLTDLSFESTKKGKSTFSASFATKLQFIELKRPLNSKGLAVGIEQVSIFLHDSNTVISFFEHSAGDIEKAILTRMSSEYTILRQSCDASMLFEAVLDAIVDLNYPVISAYSRRLNEFEVDILTHPNIEHTQELHLMINELSYLKSKISPISSMIQQLKQPEINDNISKNSALYLNDIYDHLLTFNDEIDSMTRTIENLIDLIFNTLSVATNDSMKILSLITVIFLPLSFWTGYYGMNFEKFGDLGNNVSYYWKVAVPFSVGLLLLIMWQDIYKFLRRYRKQTTRNFSDARQKRQRRAELRERRKKKSEKKNESIV